MGTDLKKLKLDSSTSWLLSAGGDKDDTVRFAVVTALCKIARVDTEILLNSVSTFYLIKDPKQLSLAHRLTLLRVAESVCKENICQIDSKVVQNLITMALNEMTRNSDFTYETQFLASDLLVSLGSKSFCMEVMDALMGKLEPGISPHPSLLHCLGALATANAFGMVPFIRGTLGTLLPSCTSLSGEQSKRLFCHLIRSFAEAIEEYMVNLDRAPDPSVTRDAFSTEMTAAFDELSTTWIHARDPQICRATLEAIGPVLPLLSKDKAVEQLPILGAVLVALFRQKQHNADPLAITHCLWHMLSIASALPAAALPDPLPEQLLKAAFDQVSVQPDISTPLLVKNHYEALRCIQVFAGSRWKDCVWELVLHKLKGVHASSGLGSSSELLLKERIRGLWVLVYLISSPDTPKSTSKDTTSVSPTPWISHLVPVLQGILSHSDVKTKKVLVRAIVALLCKEYLTGADSRPFLEFIIIHTSTLNSSSSSQSSSASNVDEQSTSELGHMCSHSLNLLASTVPSLKPVLRVLLINTLIYPPPPQSHSPASSPVHENKSHHSSPHPSSPSILRCLSLLMSNSVTESKEEESKAQMEMCADDKECKMDSKEVAEDLPSLPEALAVLARCLTLLAHPFYSSVSSALGVNTLIFMQSYAGNLHPTLPSLYNEKIPLLIQTLKDFTGDVEEFDLSAWFHQVVGLLDSSLALVADVEWTKCVGKALTSLLLDSSVTNFHHHLPVTVLCPKQRSLVYSLLGAVGVWCSDQEFLSSRIIETLLSSPYDVTSPAEAEACAAAIGRVAKRHPKVVLKSLVTKSKDFGQSSGMLSGHGGGGGFGGSIMAAKHFIKRLPFGKASHHAHEEARRRKEAGHQRANVTLLLCYGRASLAIAGDPSALAAFLDPKSSQETGAIAWILQHLDSSKGMDVRLAALATLRQICSAVLALQPQPSGLTVDSSNPNSLGRNGNLPLSPAIIQAMRHTVLTQIGGELTLLAPSIQTLNMLSRLAPSLSSDERITMLKMCFDTVFLLALTTEGLELAKQEHAKDKTCVSRVWGGSAFIGEHEDENNGSSLDEENDQNEVDWNYNENAVEDEVVHFGVVEALNQLQNFVQSILAEKTCAGTLGEIFTLLEAWMAGPREAIKGEISPVLQHGVQRMAAMLTLRSALTSYLRNFRLSFKVPSKFTECGWMAGVILPRCSDSYLPVRSIAVSCLRLLLLIVARYDEGLPGEQVLEPEDELTDIKSASDLDSEDKQEADDQLNRLANEVTSQHPDNLFHAMAELAKITCNNLRNTYILSLVEALLDRGLGDGNSTSSAGASIALNSILKAKGGYLPNHVPHILDMMLGQVSQKTCPPQTRTAAIRSVLVLATHHPKATVSALLLQALPFDDCIVDCWKTLAQEPSLSSQVLENLLSVIQESPPYEEQDGDRDRHKRKLDDRDMMRVANLAPLSAISALQEMFKCAALQEVALQLFPELLSSLLMAMGCYVGTSPPVYMAHRPTPAPMTAPRSSNIMANLKESSGSRFSFVPNRKAYKLNPARVAQGALQAFLLCSGCELAAEALLKCSNIDAGENLSSFIEMMPYLTRALCKQMPDQISRVANSLNHYAASPSANEAQLVTVTAFYAELINLGGNGSDALVEVALEHLLNLEAGESPVTSPSASCSSVTSSPEEKSPQWATPTPLLRILCLRGLANSANLINSQQKGRRLSSILRTLIRGVGEGTLVDKAVGSVALESIYGLSNLLPVIPEDTVREVGITVALHIKPYLDKENNASLRAASISLLGNIAKYGSGKDNSASPLNSSGETDDAVVSSSNWDAFEEQVKSNLVCLLLRLADSEEEVVKSCKFALREMSYLMEIHWHAKKVALMVQQHLIDNAVLQYERFMTDLIKLMVEEFPEDHLSMLVSSATSYIHASSAVIRGNAALLLGQLFGSMEEKKREDSERPSGSDLIPLESLSARLSQLLLSDPDATVRAKAAQAIARLFE